MISREITQNLQTALQQMPVVALLGPRQVGKTTLAMQLAGAKDGKPSIYLDMERDSDLNKLSDAEAYLSRMKNRLMIIDEVQQKPDLFRVMRSLVDERIRLGEKSCQFLLLGSASRDLLQQSSETLAGRIRYLEMRPLSIMEVYQNDPVGFSVDKIWLRGGFPNSFLSESNEESWNWRNDFISTYVERDIPNMGPKIPATRLKRFWTMLAHYHGQQPVMSELGRSLELSHTTVRNYLDLLTDFYMVRQLQPWSGNTKKRLVKTPKIYIRDSGLLHNLLNIADMDTLLGHPLLGASWEGFVVENILGAINNQWQYSYYRTNNQNEIDLVLEGPRHQVWAIEIKRSLAPTIRHTFHTASEDIGATQKFVVYPGTERYPIAGDTDVIGIVEFLKMLKTG